MSLHLPYTARGICISYYRANQFICQEICLKHLNINLNYQKLGKELMSQDELAVMDGGKCILQLRGVRPFLSDKYDITKHPNYPYTADADPKNAFDIEAFLSTRLKLKPNEVYDVYEVDAEGV